MKALTSVKNREDVESGQYHLKSDELARVRMPILSDGGCERDRCSRKTGLDGQSCETSEYRVQPTRASSIVRPPRTGRRQSTPSLKIDLPGAHGGLCLAKGVEHKSSAQVDLCRHRSPSPRSKKDVSSKRWVAYVADLDCMGR